MVTGVSFTTLLIKSVLFTILNLLATKMLMILKFSHLDDDDAKLMEKQVSNIGFVVFTASSLFI